MKHGIVTAALLSVSCAPAGAPESPLAAVDVVGLSSSAPSSKTAPTRQASDSAKEQELQARLAGALAYVSEIRGLPATKPVKGRLIGKAEVQRYLEQQLDEDTPKDVIEANEALLYGFGTVDQKFDYRASIVELMTSELLGFYDPKQKTFFVGGALSGDEADVTLWHELVHALQDQHYDLSHLTDWQADLGDQQAAIHALAEGDATSTMLDAMLKPRGNTALDMPESLMRAQTVLGSATATAPPILVRSLLAPYVDGLAFTNALRRRGGFPTVDEAWRSPPASTEQLLHVEKYLAREAPLVVPVPSAPTHLPELKERFHDVMGEETLRLLFEEWLPARTAAAAAADWGGDRLGVFSDDARRRWAIGWHVRFDSAKAAERAFVAFARSAPLTDPAGAQPALADAPAGRERDRLCQLRHIRGPFALVRRGADLAVTVGAFERNPVAVAPDPECSAAIAWATAILKH